MKKYLVVSVVMLAVVVAIAIVLFGQQKSSGEKMTPDEKLTTYTNTRVGYSFEYPQESDFEETSNMFPDSFGSQTDLVQFTHKGIGYTVKTHIGVTHPSLEAWFEDTNTEKAQTGVKHYDQITMGGQKAYLWNGGLIAYVMENGNIFEIGAYGETVALQDKNDPVYQKLLASFRFTR